jgi:hypothetical protein
MRGGGTGGRCERSKARDEAIARASPSCGGKIKGPEAIEKSGKQIAHVEQTCRSCDLRGCSPHPAESLCLTA